MLRMITIIIGLCALSACQTLQGAGKDIMNFGHAISGDGVVDYQSPAPSSYSKGYGYGEQRHYAGLYSSRGTSGTPTYMKNYNQQAQTNYYQQPEFMKHSYAPQQQAQAPAPMQMAQAAPMPPAYNQYAAGGYPAQAYGYGQSAGYGYPGGYSYSFTPVSYNAMAGYSSYY